MSYSKTFTRGGQVTLHNFRMFRQVASVTAVVTFLATALFFGARTYSDTTAHQRHILLSYVWADLKLAMNFKDKTKAIQGFQYPNGRWGKVRSLDIKNNLSINQQVSKFEQQVIKNGFHSVLLFFAIFIFIGGFWIWRGNAKKEKEILSGTQIVDPKTLKKLIKKKKIAYDFKLAGVPLTKDFEVNHLCISGTTGSGKTNCLNELLVQIREKHQKAVIVDTTGDYVARYFRPGKDRLLNPFDARSEPWTLWGECQSANHFDDMAASMIPLTGHDPFWSNASRMLFSVTAEQMSLRGNLSTKEFLDRLISEPLAKIRPFYDGTEAAALVDPASDKTTASVRTHLATFTRAMKYLEETASPFSIRKWIQDETITDSWLFICSTTSQRESLRSLMTSWISVAISAVMETIPDEKRRVWLIIDELSSLHKVGELPKAAAEFRKYGGCLVVGMQNIKQIQDLYGAHLSESLMSLFNTKIFFRAPEATTAQWVSKTLGEQEVSESIENISYGAHQMRDGVSLNDQRRTKPTVSYSEILTLPSLTAFLKLPAEIPVTKITFKYVEREIVGAGFVGRG